MPDASRVADAQVTVGGRRAAAFGRTLVIAIAVLAAAPAAADGFAWHAPAGCPTAAEVRTRIAHRLDADTEIGDIVVEVARAGHGFAARIDTRAVTVAGHGRTLSAARCADLADAVAVIVARLASEARAAAAATDHEPPPAPRDVAPTHVSRLEHRGREVAIPPTWGGGLRLLALSGIGITTKVGYGGEFAGFVSRREAFAEIGYARWADRPTFVVPMATAHVDVGVSLLALRGGWVSDHMPLRGWLGIELGSMHGIGVGLQDPQGSGRWAAVAAGFGVGWPISVHTRLVGTFEVAAPVERTRFVLASGMEIYEPAPASARCALGLEVAWR